MNDPTLEKICVEIDKALSGQRFGKVFTLSRFELAIDFRLPDGRYLFISIEPANPRIYLIKRRLKDLEKTSGTPSVFALSLRKKLSGAALEHAEKLSGERVLSLPLSGMDELGSEVNHFLVVQLTGRSANLFLLDGDSFILDSARETHGEGQEIGHKYGAPRRDPVPKQQDDVIFPSAGFDSLSAALDTYYLNLGEEKRFQSRITGARSKLRQELTKREKLAAKLRADLENHGDAEKWKRFGDLLLANISTARRENERIFVKDYYQEDVPEVEIIADVNLSITEAAEKFFKRYTKARNAGVEIEKRLKVIDKEIADLKNETIRLEAAIAARNENALADFAAPARKGPAAKEKKNKTPAFKGARRFISSEGFEIFVGKGSKNNDYLTFRVARSLDLWMHAADYPGSHVVVKTPGRREVPPRTLIEAAQLAAFYSDAREQPKAAVHYTQRKFVNKPKGASPGLVSLSSFKTILVEPKIAVDKS